MGKLEELKAALEAATKGEWVTEKGGTAYYPLQIRSNTEGWDHFIVAFHSWESNREDNAHFIALAHNLMPTLLEAVELLEDVAMGNSEYDDLSKRAAELLEKLK